ncbi:alginate O-acetyltransferase AlgX-related protein [Amycolatopsis sp. NPDC004378]
MSVHLRGGEPEKRLKPLTVHEAWLPRDHSMYRPRHGRQQVALVCAVVFFLAPVVSLGVFGPPSEFENRKLHDFPSLSDGWGFFGGLADWATDWLPGRQAAVQAEDGISRGLFGEPPALGAKPAAPGVGPVPSQPPPPRPDTGQLQGQTNSNYPPVVEGRDGWLFLGNDLYAKCNPIVPPATVMNELLGFRKVVEASGRRLVLIVPPDKSDLFPQYLPDQYAGKDCAPVAARTMWQRLHDDVGYLDLRGPLLGESQRQGSPIYFKQDTHWQFHGGLTMVRALAEDLRPGVTRTWTTAPKEKFDKQTDLPPLIGRTGSEPAELESLAPDGGADRTRTFFGQPNTVPIELHGPAVPGTISDKVAMIGDSFTGFANMYLAAAFTDMTIMHSDYVSQDTAAAAAKLADSDVVVLEIAERNLIGGQSPILAPAVVKTLSEQLAKHPRQ